MNTPPSKTQVLIIGAGPTGLAMAAQLLRYGIDFVILERNEKTTHLSKAIAVQARTMELLDELGLAQKAIEKGRLTTALNLFYKGRRKAAVDFSGLGEGLSPFPFALSLEQSKTETLFVDYLADHNVTINWKSEFSRVEQDVDGVRAYYKNNNGQEQHIDAAYLLGCDGAGSPVRHQLGLGFAGDTVSKLFYVADVKLSSPVINKDELFAFLIPKGFILFFPMQGFGHYRIVGILPEAKESEASITFDDIRESIRQQVVCPLEFRELLWFSSYRVHSRKADIFMKGRCFIAGDAAHIHTPAGGQGMNTGIQDAYNLAWKLAGVIKGELNAAVLDTYSTERVENARHLLQTTDRMFDVLAGTNHLVNFIRLHIFPLAVRLVSKSALAKRKVFPLISQTGIAYPHSALTVSGALGKVKSGMRIPYFVSAGGRHIFSYLTGPHFKLLYFGTGRSKPLSVPNPPELITFTEIPEALFGKATDFYVLLRPDNHISYIGKDRAVCSSFLERLSNLSSGAKK